MLRLINKDEIITALITAHEPITKDYYDMSSWDIAACQLPQSQVNYSLTGGTDAKACFNCNFFCSPDDCIIVADEIASSGVCDLWHSKPEQVINAIPVYITANDDDPSPSDSIPIIKGVAEQKPSIGILERIKSWVFPIKITPETRNFVLFKDANGSMRWLARYSNNFFDRDKEVFPQSAHEEFVNWATENNEYPELWLYHTPGSRIGKADWLDVDNGIALASGTIDKEFEGVGNKLYSEQDNLGVSHGFWPDPAYIKGNQFLKYRTFEISPLPLLAASNVGASFNVYSKELTEEAMGLTPVKRDFLLSMGMSEDNIKAIESGNKEQVSALKSLGLEYKSEPETSDITVVNNGITLEQLNEAIATAIKPYAEQITTLQGALEAKSVADKEALDKAVAETIRPANGFAGVLRPTQDLSNTGGQIKEVKDPNDPNNQSMSAFEFMQKNGLMTSINGGN